MSNNNQDMNHMQHLEAVAAADVAHLREKEATYGGSWKKRGGVGAWMMACRKFDRLECILSQDTGYNWDIFAAIRADSSGNDGSALAEIRDLRRYLLLVEAEMMAQGVVRHAAPPPVEDSSRHARQKYLMDGVVEYEKDIPWISVPGHYNMKMVDRRILSPEHWDHLPRLTLELNHKEWTETSDEYRWMYLWQEDGCKYRLSNEWIEHWGRQ